MASLLRRGVRLWVAHRWAIYAALGGAAVKEACQLLHLLEDYDPEDIDVLRARVGELEGQLARACACLVRIGDAAGVDVDVAGLVHARQAGVDEHDEREEVRRGEPAE